MTRHDQAFMGIVTGLAAVAAAGYWLFSFAVEHWPWG